MPPKRQKGDSLIGRNKIFGAAVANVHVGMGFAALSNATMQLQGAVKNPRTESYLHAELDEVGLGFVTPGFREYRYLAQQLCTTKALFRQYTTRLVRQLLDRLANPTDEAFLGYLKCSVALYRDLTPSDAATYFEAFHTVVNRALFDQKGYLIVAADRIQLIFLAQVHWLRTLGAEGARLRMVSDDDNADAKDAQPPQQEWVGPLIETVARLYLEQALSSTAVVRRLAMETFATFVRRIPDAIGVFANLLQRHVASEKPSSDDAVDQGGDADADAAATDNSDNDAEAADDHAQQSSADRSATVREALTVLAAEMLISVQGSLSTSHEASFAAFHRVFTNAPSPSLRDVASNALADALRTVQAQLSRALTVGTTALSSAQLIASVHRIVDWTQPSAVRFLLAILSELKTVRLLIQATVAVAENVTQEQHDGAKEGLQALQHALDAVATRVSAAQNDASDAALHLIGACLELVTFTATQDHTELPKLITTLVMKRVGEKAIDALVQIASSKNATGAAAKRTLGRWLQDVFEKNEARKVRFDSTHHSDDVRARGDATPFLPDPCWPAVAQAVTYVLSQDDLVAPTAYALLRCDSAALTALVTPRQKKVLKASAKKAATAAAASSPADLAIPAVLPADVLNSAFERVLSSSKKDATSGCAFDVVLELIASWSTVLPDEASLLALHAIVRKVTEAARRHLAGAADAVWVTRFARLWAVDRALDRRSLDKNNTKSTPSTDDSSRLVQLLSDLWAGLADTTGASAPSTTESHDEQQRLRSWFAVAAVINAFRDVAQRSTGGLHALTSKLKPAETATLRRVLLECLVAPQQSLRVAAIDLLAEFYAGDDSDESRVVVASLRSWRAAEVLDPLKESNGNLDIKQQQLTAISFRSSSGTMTFAEAAIAARCALGILHLRFAAVWTFALAIWQGAMKQHGYPLWREVSGHLRALIFATDPSAKHRAAALRADGTNNNSTDGTTEASAGEEDFYRALLNRDQLAIASRAAEHSSSSSTRFTEWTTEDVWQRLLEAATERSTDSLTTARTVIPAVGVVLDQCSSYEDGIKAVEDVESWTRDLLELDVTGVQGTAPLRGLEDRLALVIQSLNGAPRWSSAAMRTQLVEGISPLLTSAQGQLQRAALDGLRRLKVRPFDAWHAQLLPFTQSTKVLQTHLSTFHIDEVDSNVRSLVGGVALLLSLPRFTGTARLGGRAVNRKSEQTSVLRKITSLIADLPDTHEVGTVVEHALSYALGCFSMADSSEATDVSKAGSTTGSSAVDRFLQQLRDWMQSPKLLTRAGQKLCRSAAAALGLLERLVETLGSKFKPWSAPLIHLVLEINNFASFGIAVEGGAESVPLAPSLKQAKATLGRDASELFRHALATFPEAVVDAFTVSPQAMSHFGDLLRRNLHALSSSLRSTPNRLPAALQILRAVIDRSELLPVLGHWADAFAKCIVDTLKGCVPPASEQRVQFALNHQALYQALAAWATIVTNASTFARPLLTGPEVKARSLRALFVAPHTEAVFDALYTLVSRSQIKGGTANAAGGGAALTLSPQSWQQVLQAVAQTAAALPTKTTSPKTEQRLSSILDILLKFLTSPIASTDAEAATVALDVAIVIAGRTTQVSHGHFAALVGLVNLVTVPRLRHKLILLANAMCTVPRWTFWEVSGAPESPLVVSLRSVLARLLLGINSFATSEETAQDFTAYDYDRRFHCAHSLGTALAAAAQRLQPAASSAKAAAAAAKQAAVKRPSTGAAIADGAVRTERAFTGELDVQLPEGFDSLPPRVVLDFLALVSSTLVFYLRDHERTIRESVAQCLSSLIKFGAAFAPAHQATVVEIDEEKESDEKDNSDAVQDAPATTSSTSAAQLTFLDHVVRPTLLGSFRRGVVARDPSIRVEHLSAFGYLARDMGAHFPSFAALYNKNSDKSFFSLIASAQHRLRMNAFSLLRHARPTLLVRDVLRVFIPFCVSCLKDFAQGKQEATTTAGKSKGYAEGALATVAHLSSGLPWEAYLYILTTLLDQAREEEALRSMLVKAVIKVLDEFTYLPLQPATKEEPQPTLNKSQLRIVETLRATVLQKLLDFVIPEKKSAANTSALSGAKAKGTELAGTGKGPSSSLTRTSSNAVHLRVAVAVVKLLKWVPNGFEDHIDPLLTEIVLKLRTKTDKHRVAARKILCSMMVEVGPSKLKYVLKRLSENFVHGYQLHVLGYTVVGLLEALAPAFLIECKQYTDAMRTAPATALKPHLDLCAEMLQDVFLADYLGELGEQKEADELMSKMVEIKKSRAIDGFVFLARYCVAETALKAFVSQITWLLTPDTTSHQGTHAHYTMTASVNKKMLHGEKAAGVDLRFLDKVRLLSVRVARALMVNSTMIPVDTLRYARETLAANAAVREAKIQEFEAKDGTRRIRGNIENHVAAKRLSRQEIYEKNFAVADRPERVDVDFSTHTVISTTQNKQKLKSYKGRIAKNLGDAAKSFAKEAPATAQLLDALDEFSLKLIVSLLRQTLGLGKTKKAATITAAGTAEAPAADNAEGQQQAADEATAPAEGQDNDDDEDAPAHDSEDDLEAPEKFTSIAANGNDDGGDDDMEELDELRDAQVTIDAQCNNSTKKSKKDTAADPAAAAHAEVLDSLVSCVIATLQGEGSDAVVTGSLDALHGLIAIRPPLTSLASQGETAFQTVATFIERGGQIKTRAFRVLAAIVTHKRFELKQSDAVQLLRIVRAEVLERGDHLPSALAVLLAVVSKGTMLTEVFDIITPLTELLLQSSVSPTVRNRCVAILAKFLTEYNITREKLQSHLDLYLRNLTFPEAHGRVALLELLHVLVFRFPTAVLREEAPVLIAPLLHYLTHDEAPKVREKCAAVILSLMMNSGLDIFATMLHEWLSGDNADVRGTGARFLPFYVCAAVGLHSGQSTLAALIAGDQTTAMDVLTAARRKCDETTLTAVAADVEWLAPHAVILASDIAKTKTLKLKASVDGVDVSQVVLGDLPQAVREEAETKNWPLVFYALRTMELLMAFDPIRSGPLLSAFICDVALVRLVDHTHAWVQTSACRLVSTFLQAYAQPVFGVFDGTLKADAAERGLPRLPFVTAIATAGGKREGRKAKRPAAASTGETNATTVVATSPSEASAAAGALARRVTSQLSRVDVEETFKSSINKAMEAPLRKSLMDLFDSCARVAVANAAACGVAPALFNSLLVALAGAVDGVIRGSRVIGATVRSATAIQMMVGVVRLASASAADPAQAAAFLSASSEALIKCVQCIAICSSKEAGEHSQKLHEIAADAASALKSEQHIGDAVAAQVATMHATLAQQHAAEEQRKQLARQYAKLTAANKAEMAAKSGKQISEREAKRGVLVGDRIQRASAIREFDGLVTSRGPAKKQHRAEQAPRRGASARKGVRAH